MRLFIGIELPDEARAALTRRSTVLQSSLRARAPGAKIRWVEMANLHVTMAFLGQVEADAAEALRARLQPALDHAAFEARLGALGAFPPSGPLRVIWAGFDRGVPEMISLHGTLYQRLRPLGFDPDHRTYAPHVTLGRVQATDRHGSREVRQALDAAPGIASTFTVASVTLFRSYTLPSGSRYEVLLRVPLT